MFWVWLNVYCIYKLTHCLWFSFLSLCQSWDWITNSRGSIWKSHNRCTMLCGWSGITNPLEYSPELCWGYRSMISSFFILSDLLFRFHNLSFRIFTFIRYFWVSSTYQGHRKLALRYWKALVVSSSHAGKFYLLQQFFGGIRALWWYLFSEYIPGWHFF